MSILTDLFLTFARVGLFTFGGGYAMISIIEDACAEKKKWITHEEMMDVTVIAESTPGPIAINLATYIGHKQAGLTGAAAATLGMILPSFAIIYIISLCLDHFLEIAVIAHAFRGVRIAVGLLILSAGLNMLKKMQKKPLPRAIVLCSTAAMLLINFFSLRISSISVMLLAAAVSLALFLAKDIKKGGAGR